MNNKLTLFQKINRSFNNSTNIRTDDPVGQFANNKQTLITANDTEDYELKLMELRQQDYLNKQSESVRQNIYKDSLYYESTRLSSYMDAEAMEYFPEIATALDVFSIEATPLNEEGKILQIYSESDRVKNILEDLFYKKLNINTALPSWARNMCKFGDNFLYLKTDIKEGVTKAIQLKNIEITREETDQFEDLDGEIKNSQTIFKWASKNLSFNNFQIAHFRLTGDDRKLPYGTCMKYNTRVMTHDSIKEIKDIQIGDYVKSFDLKTQKQVLSKVLDKINSGVKKCFKIQTKHNYFEASKEHRILTYNKLNDSFEYKFVNELILGDLLVINKEFKTYSKHKIDKYIPIENKNGWSNRMDELIPDYVNNELAQLIGYMIGDGWINTHGSSLSIALGIDADINEYYIKLLQKYSGNIGHLSYSEGKELPTQYTVSSKLLKTILERLDFKGKFNEKRIPTWVFESDIEIKKSFIAGLFDADGWESEDKWTKSFHFEMSNEELVLDIKNLTQMMGYKTGNVRKRNRSDKSKGIFGRKFNKINDSFTLTFYDKKLEQAKSLDIKTRLKNNFVIEKINKITEVGEFETYDIYVENENHNFYANGVVVHNSVVEKARKVFKQLTLLEDAVLIYRITRAPERRVFKIDVGNIDDKDVDARVAEVANKFKKTSMINSNNGQIDYRTASIPTDADYFIPGRGDGSGTSIETLPGASNLGEISDLTFFQNKLFAALRVPKSFLNFEEAAGDGKNLALQDIRFLKTVNKVQQALIQELNKIAILHLLILGFDEELDNFKLTLGTPSIQADILRTEQISTKIDVYIKAVTDAGNGFSPFSMTRAKKEILGFTDDEILLDLQQQRIEKIASIENNTELLKGLYVKSGIFDDVDRRFASTTQLAPGQLEDSSGGGMGGGGSMPDLGGGDEMAGDLPPELGNDAGVAPEVGGGPDGGDTTNDLPQDNSVPDDEIELSENKYLIGESHLNDINKKTRKLIKNIDKLV